MDPFSIAVGTIGLVAALEQTRRCIKYLRDVRAASGELQDLYDDLVDLQNTLTDVGNLTVYSSSNTNSSSSVSDRGVASTPAGSELRLTAEQRSALDNVDRLVNRAARKLAELGTLLPHGGSGSSSSSSSSSRGESSRGRGSSRKSSSRSWLNAPFSAYSHSRSPSTSSTGNSSDDCYPRSRSPSPGWKFPAAEEFDEKAVLDAAEPTSIATTTDDESGKGSDVDYFSSGGQHGVHEEEPELRPPAATGTPPSPSPSLPLSITPPVARRKRDLFSWARNKSRVLKLQADLRNIQMNMVVGLVVFSSLVSPALSPQTSQTVETQSLPPLSPPPPAYGQAGHLDTSVIVNMVETEVNPDSNTSIIAEGLRNLARSPDATSSLSSPLTPLTPSSSSSLSSSTFLTPPSSPLSLPSPKSSLNPTESTLARQHSFDHRLPLRSVKLNRATEESQPVEPELKSRTGCAPWCSCQCHATTAYRFRIPLGPNSYTSINISSRGLISSVVKCTEKACKGNNQRNTSFSVSMRAPKWLSKQLQLSYYSDPRYGPELNMRLPRVVGWDHPIWRCAVAGDLPAIRSLFQSGKASPWDVNPIGGGLLHYVTDDGKFHLVKGLMEDGARANGTDDLGGHPVTIAYEHYLSGRASSDEKYQIQNAFDRDEYIETRCFTTLHKTVLGLNSDGLGVQSLLSLSTKEIDSQDAAGKTALHWATFRADHQAVKSLLEYGADPNVKDDRSRAPLSYAGDATSVHLLLGHGAKRDATDDWGRVALHWAVQEWYAGVDAVRALLEAGAAPGFRDADGETALMNACYRARDDSAKELLNWENSLNGGIDAVKVLLDAVASGSGGWEIAREILIRCDGLVDLPEALLEAAKKRTDLEALSTVATGLKENAVIMDAFQAKNCKGISVEDYMSQKVEPVLGVIRSLWFETQRTAVHVDDDAKGAKDVFFDTVEIIM